MPNQGVKISQLPCGLNSNVPEELGYAELADSACLSSTLIIENEMCWEHPVQVNKLLLGTQKSGWPERWGFRNRGALYGLCPKELSILGGERL